MTTKAKTKQPPAQQPPEFPGWSRQPPPPEGFVYWPTLLATIDAAAEFFQVTPRTIRNWIDEDAPAVHREQEKLPPLICIHSLGRWLALQRKNRPDFGKHGGYR